MSQKAGAKAPGLFWTKELQEDALEEQLGLLAQTLPAQSPQKVISKTI